MRGSPCSIYFLALSITNLILLDYAVSTRFYANENTNPSSYSLVYCKLSLYLVHTLLMISRTYIVLICIDRFCMCSPNALIRRFSTQRNALRIVIIVPFFWFIIAIHIPIFSIIQSQRCIMSGIYPFIYSIYSLCVAGIIPPLLMIIFTLLTYRTMRKMRARVIPVSLTMQMRIQRRDHQLFGISICQVIIYILSTWLYPGITFYFAFIKRADPQTTVELYLNLFGGVLLIYLNSSVTFFIYMCMSSSFRTEFKKFILIYCLRRPIVNTGMKTINTINRKNIPIS